VEVFPSVELDLPVEEPDRDVVEMSGGSTDDREVPSREEGEDVGLEFVGDGEKRHGWREEGVGGAEEEQENGLQLQGLPGMRERDRSPALTGKVGLRRVVMRAKELFPERRKAR